MNYVSKQPAKYSESTQNSANKSAVSPFADQRASTATQLKQQNIMRTAHSPNVIQQMTAEEAPIQGEFESDAPAQLQEAPAAKPNNTGLPDNLKSGIENLSGYAMDDVKVHYNSDRPAQLNAHAYAQGTDIHVAPGQEQHLPHEAWHVVQQKQGRVQPTMQMKAGVPVNDDAGLENEADVMGSKALQFVEKSSRESLLLRNVSSNAMQLKTEVDWSSQNFSYMDMQNNEIKTKEVGNTMVAKLDPNEPLQGADAQSSFQKDMYDSLKHFWNPGSKHWVRGHLLNANLGGPNVAPNLFPITGHANGDHLNYVENHVKQWVIDGRYVTYSITATQNSGTVSVGSVDGVPNTSGSFLCYAETTDNDIKEKKVINRIIHSTPVKRNTPGGDSDDPGHASSWDTNDAQVGGIISLTQAQYNFLVELLDNKESLQDAINKSSITELEYLELLAAADSATEDELEADKESDKVGQRVTNAKLKSWLGKSLNNTEADTWLTTYKVATTSNEYKRSSS